MAHAATTHVLYLHGFRSSPASFKARRLQDWCAVHRPDVVWWSPQLPPSPKDALTLVHAGIRDWPHTSMVVAGSSLGGFYATAVAQATGCRALLLNPAVHPARDLARHIGEQTQYHAPEERFFFRPEFIDALTALAVPHITRPERYSAVIAKGDDVLDWREMLARYPGASVLVLEGSDHGLSDFEDHLPFVLHALGLQAADVSSTPSTAAPP